MIAVDTNILVYAHRVDLAPHARAAEALAEALSGSERVGFCWHVIHEFIAVVTNPRSMSSPTSVGLAVAQVEDWLSSPAATLLREGPRHLATLSGLLIEGGVAGGGVHDARIAATCLDAGVRELWTADRDFGRFPQLRVRNPLAA